MLAGRSQFTRIWELSGSRGEAHLGEPRRSASSPLSNAEVRHLSDLWIVKGHAHLSSSNQFHLFLCRLNTVKGLKGDAILGPIAKIDLDAINIDYSDPSKGRIVHIDLSEDDVEKFAYGASAADAIIVRDSDDSGDEVTAVKSMKGPDFRPDTRRPVYPPLDRGTCALFKNWIGLQDGIEHIGNKDLSRRAMNSLCQDKFLNDEVINEYMHLLARCRSGTYYLSSFTYTLFRMELNSESPNFAKFLRFAKRVDFSCHDYVLFPINQGFHWCLVVAYPRQLKLVYYDSLGGQDTLCLRLIEAFFQARGEINPAETRFKMKWTLEYIGPDSEEPIPRQEDGVSCGLFVCALADVLTAGGGPSGRWGYSQQDMSGFRTLVQCLMTTFQNV